jgi:hypothetical protein
MENNQRNSNNRSGNERMDQQDQTRDQQRNWNNESMNTASNMREELQREQDSSGSGRSYDYGSQGSSEEDTNQDLGRNSNQQNVSNPINTPGKGNDNMPGRSDSRAGSGSGMTTKQSITGSDFDGQNRDS